VPVAVRGGERGHGRIRAEVIVIGAGAVGLDIAARVGSGSPEQDHAAMSKTHHLMFRLQKPTSLPRQHTFIQKNEGGRSRGCGWLLLVRESPGCRVRLVLFD